MPLSEAEAVLSLDSSDISSASINISYSTMVLREILIV